MRRDNYCPGHNDVIFGSNDSTNNCFDLYHDGHYYSNFNHQNHDNDDHD